MSRCLGRMSASPLVLPPGANNGLKGPGFGIPTVSQNNNTGGGQMPYEPIPDLAEQVNNQERAKYIKGTVVSF